MEKITVLMPTYNRASCIDRAINSIACQTYPEWELIIYDDGSTDKTRLTLEYFSLNNKRIKIIGESENKGVSYARNQLLGACNTTWACWMDSDDVSNVHRLENQVASIAPGRMVFTQWKWTQSYGEANWTDVGEKGIREEKAFASVMFEIDKAITFKEGMNFGGEDWDWLGRMMLGKEIVVLPEVLYYIRNHEDRIGRWKRKVKELLTPEEYSTLSYQRALELYKARSGGRGV
jgi:glycosyltransferase involved in cell wall biosynthesis